MERFRSEDGTNCYSQLQLLAGRTLRSIDFRSRGGGAVGDSGSSGRKPMGGSSPPFRTNLFLKPSDLFVFNPESDTW